MKIKKYYLFILIFICNPIYGSDFFCKNISLNKEPIDPFDEYESQFSAKLISNKSTNFINWSNEGFRKCNSIKSDNF